MRKWLLRLLYALPVIGFVGYGFADYTATQGAGSTVFAFVCSSTKICPASVLINSSNVEIATASNPLQVSLANTAANGTAVTVSGTVTANAGTNLNTSTLATSAKQPAIGTAGASSTDVLTVQGIASMTPFLVNPGTAANWGLGAIGSAPPANGQLVGLFDGTNQRRFIGDETNGLKVQCTTGCSGSGGTSSSFGSAFPAVGTAIGLTNGTNMVAWSAASNYGTSPGAIAVPAVNANVTNANANGRAVVANSSPVVPVAAASTAGAIVPNNTTAVVVKGSAGTLFGVQVYGINSAPAYLKIYNATSATCGSGTPVKRIMIPAASTAANGAGSNVTFGPGLAMGIGITYCVTTGITDADTGAPTANNFLVNVDYE